MWLTPTYCVRMTMSSPGEQRLLWGWEAFFEEVDTFLGSASRQYGTANESFSEHVVERLQPCIINISTLQDHLLHASDAWITGQPSEEDLVVIEHYSSLLSELLEVLRGISHQWQAYTDHLQSQQSAATSYRAPVMASRAPGRPRFDITQDQLQYLHSLSFSWVQIASVLGVSRMTIYPRRVEFGMLNSATRTMSDEELRSAVREMHAVQPELGEVMIWGRLRAMGYRICRERLRRAIRG